LFWLVVPPKQQANKSLLLKSWPNANPSATTMGGITSNNKKRRAGRGKTNTMPACPRLVFVFVLVLCCFVFSPKSFRLPTEMQLHISNIPQHPLAADF